MPILWRYLLFSFLRLFVFSTSSFILVLLVSRCKEIARFAALNGTWDVTLLFVLHQIPLILPLAIPISAFIAAFLLFQNLSRSGEVTAFLASGMRKSSLLTPILILALALSCAHFAFCAKTAPFSRRQAKALLYHETSSNPLLLLQRQNLIKMKSNYFKMTVEKEGKRAKDLLLIAHNRSQDRLSLLSMEHLSLSDATCYGENVNLIAHLRGSEDHFDPLFIEHEKTLSTAAENISSFLKKKRPPLDAASLEFPLLQIRAHEKGKIGRQAFLEMCRKGSLALSVFTLTWLGAAFAIDQKRNPSKKPLFYALLMATLLIVSYLFGKEMKKNLSLAFSIFFLPHPIIWICSFCKKS